MKRKFLILTLCFTIIFSSINFKKSYADGGVISLPILATVSALAVGTGIIINNNDDLYDMGRIFYDWVDRHNTLTWQTIQSVFLSSTTLVGNKVSVDSKFLDIVKEFFDFKFKNDVPFVGSVGDIPFGKTQDYQLGFTDYGASFGNAVYIGLDSNMEALYFHYYISSYSNKLSYKFDSSPTFTTSYMSSSNIYVSDVNKKLYLYSDYDSSNTLRVYCGLVGSSTVECLNPTYRLDLGMVGIPYNGGYTWDNIESKKENDSIALPIPGDLSSLVGQGSTDFWDNTDNLVGSGNISIPNVENPSISLDNTTSFPNTNVDTSNPSVPDVDAPTVDGILPAFPSFGDSLDFSPMYLTNVTEKFPFSLPWDIGRLIQKFDVEPVAPIFEVPIVSETITLDLTEFSELASIVRFFVLVGFILALIFISTKLMA